MIVNLYFIVFALYKLFLIDYHITGGSAEFETVATNKLRILYELVGSHIRGVYVHL